MTVQVNGEARTLAGALSVSALIAELGLSLPRVAVELNGEILPKSRFDETRLSEGDALEVVQFVGGG